MIYLVLTVTAIAFLFLDRFSARWEQDDKAAELLLQERNDRVIAEALYDKAKAQAATYAEELLVERFKVRELLSEVERLQRQQLLSGAGLQAAPGQVMQ